MKAIYLINIKDKNLEVVRLIPPIQLDGAIATFKTEGKVVCEIEVCFSQVPIRRDNRGVILSTFDELEAKAFTVVSYVANQVFIKTGVEVIPEPGEIALDSPRLEPETPEEESELSGHPRTTARTIFGKASVRVQLDDQGMSEMFRHSKAIAYYAEARRVANPFMKFEWFYKVVEYFCSQDGTVSGSDLDNEVSQHVSRFDSRFTIEFARKIRKLRIGCVHPHATNAIPLDPNQIQHLREVEEHLSRIDHLARLLIQHPPL